MMSISLLILCLCGLLVGIAAVVAAYIVLQRADQSSPSAVTLPEPQKIISPNGNLSASIQKRADGLYQVEVQRLDKDDSLESGVVLTWRRIAGPSIFPNLEEATQYASAQVNLGIDEPS